MKKFYLTSALALMLLPSLAVAQTMTREQVENIIKDYIQNNPEVILDAVEAYGIEQQQADFEAQQKAVQDHLGWLENNDMLPVAGNPDGDVTIIEFFDYNCGYCKKALGDVMKLLESDKNLKFVLVDMPILGRMSETAAKWAMAAKEQDAYMEYHIALMESSGMITDQKLEQIAEKIGLNVEKMRTDSKSKAIADKLALKSAKAAEMGISGTPAFIIDGQLYGGYIGLDKMREAVAQARSEG